MDKELVSNKEDQYQSFNLSKKKDIESYNKLLEKYKSNAYENFRINCEQYYLDYNRQYNKIFKN